MGKDTGEVLVSIIAVLIIWLRIKKMRPHLLGDILCFGVLFCCLVSMGSGPVEPALIGSTILTIAVRIGAKIYDLGKANSAAAEPKTEAAQTEQAEQVAAEKPKTQEEQKTAASDKSKVQQTLKECLCCRKPLKGATCKHCGFDYTAEPVYLLCLVPPKKLQIQLDEET